MQCDMSTPDKKRCPKDAVHHWGPVNCCCEHFSALVEGIYDLQQAVTQRRHELLVEMFETDRKHSSKLAGKLCEVPDPLK